VGGAGNAREQTIAHGCRIMPFMRVFNEKGRKGIRPFSLTLQPDVKTLTGTVAALFFLRIEEEIPVQYIHGQHDYYHDVRPVLGIQKILIKRAEFHCALLCPNGCP
jgi:hypothetical protein